MKNKKLKQFALGNLILGYVMICLFSLLVLLNRGAEEVVVTSNPTIESETQEEDLFNGSHEKEVVYIDGHRSNNLITRDYDVGRDRLTGVILDDDPDVVVVRDDIIDNIAVVGNPDHVVLHDRNLNRDIILDETVDERSIGGAVGHDVRGGIHRGGGVDHVGRKDRVRDRVGEVSDAGLLDRRLAELKGDSIGVVDVAALEQAILEDKEEEFGVDADEDFGNLTLANDNDNADFDLDVNALEANGRGGKGYGLDKGELYAYNFPSQGVGAGVGSPAIGAGVGAAGIGAGIGEAILDGQTVPTLGGIGTSATQPLEGEAAGAPPTDGVGGLACGAGAGGAAGLVTRMVSEKLGLGVGNGKGCAKHGAGCDGHHGHGGRGHDYEHLPRDGALHIMMHVDGSGSILNTRKQLELMKETLLKDALLPYYKNDEQLYNRRVTIVDGNGERTLQFFNTAAEKDNVLALVFQDEAAPDYHLPNFNKKPQDAYSEDLSKLKSKLNGYGGLYRGIMFQVDRGRTFAKSFKEMVECAWKGEGYLATENLKKYYREENQHHIKNKDGIVFSDEYHAKDSGDPEYYLNLIFEASKRVGLDLNIYGAGQTDGKYNDR